MIHEEKHLTSALTSEDKVSAKGKSVKELSKELCKKSGCHHKCHDTKDCVVEDEAREYLPFMLTNEGKVSEKVKQIEEMAEDLRYCHTEFVGDYGDVYTDYSKTAEKLAIMGYRKQSEGEWVFKRTYYEADECNCSVCGQLMTTAKDVRMNFCPNCGAKMKGGAE